MIRFVFEINIVFNSSSIQNQIVLRNVADESLFLLKNDKDRKSGEIKLLLNTKISDERFAFLTNLGKTNYRLVNEC